MGTGAAVSVTEELGPWSVPTPEHPAAGYEGQ